MASVKKEEAFERRLILPSLLADEGTATF